MRETRATSSMKATRRERRRKTRGEREARSVDAVRGDDHVVDAARTFVFAYAVVSTLAPRRTPRILDDPVRFGRPSNRGEAARAVADDEDAVIERLGVAEPRAGDAADVTLHPRSVDPDGQWAVFDQRRRHLFFVVADEGEVLERRAEFAFLRLALALLADVRVRLLGIDASVLYDVLHRVRRQAAVTARIARVRHVWIATDVAVHELLFAQFNELSGADEVRALDRTRR